MADQPDTCITPVLVSCLCAVSFTILWVWLLTPAPYVPPPERELPEPAPVIPPSSLLASGQIAYFAMQTAPPGWLVCDGTSYLVSSWPELFGAIGLVFGVGSDKTGGTTFNVPDLRGQFIRGFDSVGNTDRDRGGKGFGTTQGDMFGRHNHGPDMGRRGDASERLIRYGDNDQRVSFGRSEDTGGTETRPKNVALLPCIKV